MKSITGNFRTDNSSIEFGRVATNSQISLMENKVKKLEFQVNKDKQVMLKVKNFVEDWPLLSTREKLDYKKSKRNSSINRSSLIALKPILEIALASRESISRVPSLTDIMDYAEEKDIEPSLASKHFTDNKVELLYPRQIELMAINLNRINRTFKNADEPIFGSSKDTKLKWLDIATKREDATYGKGRQPNKIISDANKKEFDKIVKKINKLEKDYIHDAIKDHIGHKTKIFTPKDIVNITSIKYRDLKSKDQFQNIIRLDSELDNELGGWLKKVVAFVSAPVRIVLSPAQKFATSTMNRVLNNTLKSSIVRKNIPSHLYSSLANLSEVSAKIAVGKINKENLRKAVKYVGQAAVSVGRVGLKVSSMSMKPVTSLGRSALKTSGGSFVDKYTGGIMTSALNLSDVRGQLADNRKDIDWKSRGIDALKVGLAVSGGAGGVLVSAGTRVATEKTSLGRTSLGRGAIRVGAAYASGGGNVLQNLAAQRTRAIVKRKVEPKVSRKLGSTATSALFDSAAMVGGGQASSFSSAITKVGTKIATKRAVSHVAGDTAGLIVSEAASSSVGNDSTRSSGGITVQPSMGKTFSQAIAKSVAKEGTKRVVSHVAGDTAASIVSTSLSQSYDTTVVTGEDGEPMERTNPSFLEVLGQEIKKESQTRVISSLDKKTGGKFSKITKINSIAMKYKDMTPEDFKERVEDEKENLYDRIEEERLIAEQRADKIKSQFKDANDKTLMQRIEDEERRLSSKIKDMQDSFQKGMKKAMEDFKEFDTVQFLKDESRRVGERVSKEADRFLSNASNKMWSLAKKYGKHLLAYLMWKYGPRPDYDELITSEDKSLYKNWKAPKTGLVKRRKMGIGTKLALGVGAIVAAKVAMG